MRSDQEPKMFLILKKMSDNAKATKARDIEVTTKALGSVHI